MKKVSKADVMRRAWEIKREDASYIWGLCLKMAWAEAKAGKVEETKEQKIERMIELGFRRWTKGSMDRLYIDAGQLGLKCEYYGTGNIRRAMFEDYAISNSEARRMKASRTYIDIKTWTVVSDNRILKEAAEKLAA